MKRVLFSLVAVASAGVVALSGTRSFFSDTEVSADNTFQAGGVDLKIDSTAHYNGMICDVATNTWLPENPQSSPLPFQFPISGSPCFGSWILSDLTQERFFDFADLKPGDMGENTISMHIVDNDAWACMEFNNFQNNDPSLTEPENEVDQTEGAGAGELAQSLTMFGWYDDGDNIFEPPAEVPLFTPVIQTAEEILNDSVITLADSTTGNGPISGGPLNDPTKTKYVGLQWCLGLLTVDADTGETSCDGSNLGNETQTDQIMTDVTFRIEQARNNSAFVCNEEDEACLLSGEGFASIIEATAQAKRRDGTNVLATRSNPNSLLGVANATGNPPTEGNFFALGLGGNVTLGFANKVFDIPGMDISIYEATGGRSTYPTESAKIEVAQTPAGPWTQIGVVDSDKVLDADGVGVDQLDINGVFPWITYIRITDTSNVANFPLASFATADGFDVDAVKVLNMCLDEVR